jgi:hypothetical protein
LAQHGREFTGTAPLSDVTDNAVAERFDEAREFLERAFHFVDRDPRGLDRHKDGIRLREL